MQLVSGLALFVGLSLPSTLRAQTLTAKLTLQPPPPSIWVDGIGNGFRQDTLHAGFALGAGFGTKVFGTTRDHHIALSSIHLDWVFSDVVAKDKWYRGNWEWINELFSGAQFYPKSRYVVGCTTGLRYDIATGTRWIPFVDGGVGLSGTDIDTPDLSGTFQFNVQIGVGTYYFFRDDTAATFQYRWLHFSDAGITSPNHGANTQMFMAGLTWFF